MICQVCGKKTATTHIKSIVNGHLTQYHLCSDCAREKGYAAPFEDWGFSMNSLLGGLMGVGTMPETVLRCPTCGSSFEEISKTGNVGCADCYRTFREQLLPVIQRIHGTSKHKGKTPGRAALRVVDENRSMMPVEADSPLEAKKKLLRQAIEEQNFEQAAILRDEIKEMEKHD